MPRLPPAEKLPLALRKNIRDCWESKKAGFETTLSATLGTAWTIDVDARALFPYATSDYARDSLGALLSEYVDGAVDHMGRFADRHGADGVATLNAVASKHVLTVDVDETDDAVRDGGCAVRDGRLAILFGATRLGVNVGDALADDKLLRAVEAVEARTASASAISLSARTNIAQSYARQIEAVRARVAATLARADVQLAPNFAATYAALAAAGVEAYKYDANLGSFALAYFAGVADQLARQQFGADDLLREGFHEAVPTGVIALRIVDRLAYALYCEVVVEDGTLYVQTTADRYGVNMDDAAEMLVDQL